MLQKLKPCVECLKTLKKGFSQIRIEKWDNDLDSVCFRISYVLLTWTRLCKKIAYGLKYLRNQTGGCNALKLLQPGSAYAYNMLSNKMKSIFWKGIPAADYKIFKNIIWIGKWQSYC